jgi:hypothetical protein
MTQTVEAILKATGKTEVFNRAELPVTCPKCSEEKIVDFFQVHPQVILNQRGEDTNMYYAHETCSNGHVNDYRIQLPVKK